MSSDMYNKRNKQQLDKLYDDKLHIEAYQFLSCEDVTSEPWKALRKSIRKICQLNITQKVYLHLTYMPT